MSHPNLFEFATSELSQDAFICWLLSWAKKEYEVGSEKDRALNKVALDILSMFFEKANKKMPISIDSIEVKRQVNNIDILCVVNETYAVLIEDKVGTVQHSNQLVRYKQFITTKHVKQFTEDRIVPIYLQTHDQSNYIKAIRDGFYPVLRKDLLQAFDNINIDVAKHSDIYANFYEYLQSIENAVQSFRDKPISDWNRRAWIGFFQYLQAQLGEGNWKYVANPSGGFMGFWCFGYVVGDINIYLQLQEDMVCLKMKVPNKDERKNARSSLYSVFIKESENFELKVNKPKRFGNGKTMTFAVVDTDIFDRNTDKPIELEAVVELMNKLKLFISHCVDMYEQQQTRV